jgi:MFS family permease
MQPKPHDAIAPISRRDLIAWTCVSIAYAVAFLQRVCPQTIVDDLARDFGVGADGLGIIASAYFIGYMLMQFPAGVLVDTYGVRRLVIWSLAASSSGTLLFAAAPNVPIAFLARLIIACGDALIFTALIKLVAQQFRERQFGIMSGLSQLSGYAGGVLAATPLALTVAWIGWRASFAGIGVFCFFNLVLAASILPVRVSTAKPPVLSAILFSALAELKSRESWGCLLTFSSHFVAVTTISGVWGVPLLTDAYGLERHHATTALVLFMVGCMVGSVVFGHFVDRIQSLVRAHILMCLLRSGCLALLIPTIGTAIGLEAVFGAFVILGLVAGGMTPMILKAVRNIYSVARLGTGAAINTTSAGLLTASLQPVLGYALSASWSGMQRNGVPVYSAAGYNAVVLILAFISLIGIAGVLLMRRRI